jgi:hypothetical protein
MDATLALLGIVTYEPQVIDVVTPHRRPQERGIRFHHSLLECAATHEIDHVRTASVAFALRGLAARVPTERLTKLMRETRYHHYLDLTQLWAVTHAMSNQPGHRAMMVALEAFDRGDNGAWSSVEQRGWEVLHDVVDDEIPIRNEQLRYGQRNLFPDLRWGMSGVSVEFDGPPHLYVDVLGDDAAKDRTLRALGDLVIRVPWFDLTQRPAAVRDDVRRAILDHRIIMRTRRTRSTAM